jgi:hypothetical protein
VIGGSRKQRPMAGVGISGIKPSDSSATVLIYVDNTRNSAARVRNLFHFWAKNRD